MRSRTGAAVVLAVLALVGAPAAAQQRDSAAFGPVLPLDEAIALAQRNNPSHLQTVTARERAGAAVRSARGALLPSITGDFATQYREGRQQFFNGVAFGATSDVLSSSAGISIGENLSAASFYNVRAQRAALAAADADVIGSQQSLRTAVTQQYLTVLQQQARATLQDTLLASARAQLDLARAREAVGAATVLDVRRAEVAVGQATVARLQARNQIDIEQLRLFQQLGVPQPATVRLTTTLPVAEPTFDVGQLLATARQRNPALEALHAREQAAEIGVRSARSLYLPTLSLGTSIGGYTTQNTDAEIAVNQARQQTLGQRTSCFATDSLRRGAGLPSVADRCAAITFTDAQAAAIRSANSQFPFGFTRNPYTVSARLSLPFFDNFNREQRIEEASAQRNDVRYALRAQELRLTADVTAATLTLRAAYQTVQLQEQTARTAREALALVQERFRLGASTYVDVAQARADYERAETDRINAVYDYHKAYAALESAVGRPLR